MVPAAILFDMDDTILAYDAGLDTDECWRLACSAHLVGSVFEARIADAIREIKRQASWYWSDPERHRIGRMDLSKARAGFVAAALRTIAGGKPDADSAGGKDEHGKANAGAGGLGLGGDWAFEPSLCDRIATDYGKARDALVGVYPGALDTIAYIRQMGIPIALLTNGASLPQRAKIERFGLDRLFEHILVEEEFGVGKPEPEVYRHALRLLGVAPENAWMVGDNYQWEIVAPQELGMRGIWLNHKEVDPASLPVQPYRVIRTLSELIPLLEQHADNGSRRA